MQVILLQDIPGRGFQGDLVEVSEGYATSFLFPQALAVVATPEAIAAREQQEQGKPIESTKAQVAGQKRAEKLEGSELVYIAPVQEGSLVLQEPVTAADLVKLIKKETGISIERDDLLGYKPITEAGQYRLSLDVGGGFEAEIVVTVEGSRAV